MNDTLLYKSKRTTLSLWQEYRVYPDRLELQSWFLLHTLVVPANEIRAVEVRPSVFSGQKGFTWGVKIDNCNLCRHVLLTKKSGQQRPRFTFATLHRFFSVLASSIYHTPRLCYSFGKRRHSGDDFSERPV